MRDRELVLPVVVEHGQTRGAGPHSFQLVEFCRHFDHALGHFEGVREDRHQVTITVFETLVPEDDLRQHVHHEVGDIVTTLPVTVANDIQRKVALHAQYAPCVLIGPFLLCALHACDPKLAACEVHVFGPAMHHRGLGERDDLLPVRTNGRTEMYTSECVVDDAAHEREDVAVTKLCREHFDGFAIVLLIAVVLYLPWRGSLALTPTEAAAKCTKGEVAGIAGIADADGADRLLPAASVVVPLRAVPRGSRRGRRHRGHPSPRLGRRHAGLGEGTAAGAATSGSSDCRDV
mmetsp:Transcript_2122/g.6267  ORF Transcript_2122/g.6267 Transcript_2122/m.6267 type:complete len:290 (-) Transcript_2122:296-1165(-)